MGASDVCFVAERVAAEMKDSWNGLFSNMPRQLHKLLTMPDMKTVAVRKLPIRNIVRVNLGWYRFDE